MTGRQVSCLFALLLFSMSNNASATLVDSASIGFGVGDPHSIRGGRFALQKDWNLDWEIVEGQFIFTGYWDLSIAYWKANSVPSGTNDHLYATAIAPMFRIEALKPFGRSQIYPYLEAGVGVSYLTERKLGRRSYGSYFHFQDIMGGGVRIGKEKRVDLSIDYLHYSNANIVPPNNGLDIKTLVSLRYYFN